jgi:omega-6 fatty acid desaturase (delta-12 desaturase)
MPQPSNRPFWCATLAPYAKPRLGRSLLDIGTSVVPYLLLSFSMYLLIGYSPLLVGFLALPAAGFLVRTFILFHDCSHGSLLPSKRANAYLGIATTTPSTTRRRATSSDVEWEMS